MYEIIQLRREVTGLKKLIECLKEQQSNELPVYLLQDNQDNSFELLANNESVSTVTINVPTSLSDLSNTETNYITLNDLPSTSDTFPTGLSLNANNELVITLNNGQTVSENLNALVGTGGGQSPTGLEVISEGVSTGHRIIGRNPINYGNIGLNAVDLSFSNSGSTTNGATGITSYAEGENTTASGFRAHAQGFETEASGTNSHAEGSFSVASGITSHAEGTRTEASGLNSHAEGQNTEASGVNSHAEGVSTEASGLISHAEGDNTEASGTVSHAEGIGTRARGTASHSEGLSTIASGDFSHAGGFANIAPSYGETSIGILGTLYEVGSATSNSPEDRVFNVGNGLDLGAESTRSDAFTIYKNGGVTIHPTAPAAITNAQSGMLRFNSTTNKHQGFDGTQWNDLY